MVDPLQNHLRGASIHRDEQIRELFEPYLAWLDETGVALVLQMHVLRSVNPKHSPLNAVPAGVVSVAKAVYLFGDDPRPGADPNLRVLAAADKFNFGPLPESRLFEYETKLVTVKNRTTGRKRRRDYGLWVARGSTTVSAKALLVTLAPETKDRKSDRVGWVLLEALREGPLAVADLRKLIEKLDPPTSWRTAERVAHEMGIEVDEDPNDARKKWWRLPDSILATLEEVTETDDEVELREVAIDVPDSVPEEWTDSSDEEAA